MARSRLTLSDIGIIELINKMNLKKLISQVPLNPLNTTIKAERQTINKNNNLLNLLSSISSLPIFVDAYLEFILDLVSIPVKTTQPSTNPAEARTVFVHSVFSRLSDS